MSACLLNDDEVDRVLRAVPAGVLLEAG